MEEVFRTLDVTFPQVVLVDEDDDEFRWHHHLLMASVQGSRWISLDPDLRLAVVDLGDRENPCDLEAKMASDFSFKQFLNSSY